MSIELFTKQSGSWATLCRPKCMNSAQINRNRFTLQFRLKLFKKPLVYSLNGINCRKKSFCLLCRKSTHWKRTWKNCVQPSFCQSNVKFLNIELWPECATICNIPAGEVLDRLFFAFCLQTTEMVSFVFISCFCLSVFVWLKSIDSIDCCRVLIKNQYSFNWSYCQETIKSERKPIRFTSFFRQEVNKNVKLFASSLLSSSFTLTLTSSSSSFACLKETIWENGLDVKRIDLIDLRRKSISFVFLSLSLSLFYFLKTMLKSDTQSVAKR